MGEQCFVEYFKKLANKRKASNHDNWVSALKYLEPFTNGKLIFADLSEKKFEDFKEYLLTTKSNKSDKATLSQNSAVSYFNKVKAALKQAYKDGILQTDLNAKIKPIKAADTRREFLTLDELNQLVKTPCNNPMLKRAALFSALTGMAHKEIMNMKWKDISTNDKNEYLVLSKRQKTQKDNYLPIAAQAYSLTDGAANPKDMAQGENVFEGFTYSAYHNKHLYQWIGAAGITKDITFHCFRHTYATLQLFNGTDIYTVSKMLGHKDLKTTQIYAKIVDEAKRDTTNKIQLDM
jgi:integrase